MSNPVSNNQLEQLSQNFEQFETSLNGSKGSIHDTRKEAISSFLKSGFPTSKNEEYKYTDLSKLVGKKVDFSQRRKGSELDHEKVSDRIVEGLDAYELTFVNGHFQVELSNLPELDGVRVSGFREALINYEQTLDDHFSKYASFEKDELVALNTGFSEDGSFIHIKKGQRLDKPVVLNYINDVHENQTQNYPRNLVVAEESSELTIIEIYHDLGEDTSFTNEVTEIVIAENAKLDHYKLQLNNDKAFYTGTTQVSQATSSTFTSYTFTTGGAVIRNNLNVDQEGEGCETNMYGLYLVDGSAHVDNHTTVDHKKPNSYSNELYKGILRDKARGVFNGKIYVRSEAQKTNAFQSNKNILLSDTSVVNTKPQLEIWADDVKCSHGCTTGQIDEEALFYMQARGLSKESARALLLYAFATEVLENVRVENIKVFLEKTISKHLYR